MVTMQSAPEAWNAATPSCTFWMVGVRFNVAENRVGKPGGIEQVRDLFRHAEFDQIRVRTDKRFFVPAGGELRTMFSMAPWPWYEIVLRTIRSAITKYNSFWPGKTGEIPILLCKDNRIFSLL